MNFAFTIILISVQGVYNILILLASLNIFLR